MTDPEFEPVESLYLHVPFCAHKCGYCAFYSAPSNGDIIQRYVQALVRELEMVAPDSAPRTIFFGGGTPSLLSLAQWRTILESMERLNLTGATEWTVECNPATVSLDKATLLRSFGVNRISMGVQSLNETLLERLGRVHTRAAVFKSFDILRKAGFENINLDLMFAIPGQTLDVWRETLRETAAMGSEHLSSYEVIYEEDTPLFEQLQAGEIDVDEDLACAMYEALVSFADSQGFQQYEIANFARPGGGGALPDYACRHNINYWRGGYYHGLGPSAAGHVRGVRSKNISNTEIYCAELEAGRRPVDWTESLPPIRRAGEIAAFGLRMNAGWPFDEFKRRTGFDLHAEWSAEMRTLTEMNYAEETAGHFRLTGKGLRHADWAAEQFLRLG